MFLTKLKNYQKTSIKNLNYKEHKMENLEETIDLMKSNDYKERFIAEYFQGKIRYDKLTTFIFNIEKAEQKGEIPPKHDCPVFLLKLQKKCMGQYLAILEERAKFENIDIMQEISERIAFENEVENKWVTERDLRQQREYEDELKKRF